MEEQFCPCCKNRCPVTDLSCHRGREYFAVRGEGGERGESPREADEVVTLLRKCGHTLHHGHGHNAVTIEGLTEDERATLIVLLKKCLSSIE